MRLFCIWLALSLGTLAHAEASKSKVSAFQLGSVFPAPAGILFPGLATAAGINPAALGAAKGTAIQVALEPALRSGDGNHYFGSFATSKRGLGFGLGLNGISRAGAKLTNGGFAGIGYNMEKVNLGIAIQDTDFSSSGSTNVHIGGLIGDGHGLTLGFVLYHLDSSAQLDVGVGFNSGKRYNLEANVIFPSFGRGGGRSYGLSLGANIFIDLLTFLFRTTYYTSPNSYVHTLGVGVWLNQMFNVGIQFSTPRSWTLGVTLVL